ncbi:MAG: hypothetical protein JNL41_11130 [Phenylobacterium sp.]|uniref:sulfotransferase family protein n=1 Tax=Phenylobacterium sp. TaxID=1871053 RepID=UPI001A494D8A|nr:hypothetical protein [Phenylobacterium sp.]MBL8554821.1 hypothetical protein [Phenylobacterium sp.]
MSDTSATRTAWLVLGMHRSGTSAVTRLLALAGCDLPADVMPGDEHNAKGYFEPWKIAIFNDERLRAAGSAWDDAFAYPFRPLPPPEEKAWLKRAAALFDDDFGHAANPLMKDPRATVLLPFWRAVLAQKTCAARCVIPVRHPLAVAGSLKRRDGFTDEKSVLVWTCYMLAAEAYTRDLPRAFVGYDALLADWRAEVKRIEAALGGPLPNLTDAGAQEIDGFLTKDLRHNAGEAGLEALGWAGAIAADVHGWFAETAAGGRPDRKRLDHAAAKLARRAEDIGALVSPQARDLATARSELKDARDQLIGAKAFQADLRAEMKKERKALEAGWRADLRRLEAAQGALARINAELDAALRD